jgi:hypothetical protein
MHGLPSALIKVPAAAGRSQGGDAMHWVRVTNPQYEQSRRYAGQVGEVVGRWGPENSATARDGYLVEFADGEIVGITDQEIQPVEDPDVPERTTPESCD